MKQNILLVGGRTKERALAVSLLGKDYRVTAVNDSLEDCQKLARIDRLAVIHGDGTKTYVLEDAGAAEADIAIALTSKDEDNLVICGLCKKRFGVGKTVSLVSDPRKTDFFYKMGVDGVVCAISAVTGIIEQQAFMDKIAAMVPIGEGRLSVAEVPILAASPAVGKKLWELDLPKEVIIGCILRGEKAMVPRGDTRIAEGDMLVIISDHRQELAAVRELTGR